MSHYLFSITNDDVVVSLFVTYLGIYTLLSTPVVSAATSARPFCRENFGIFAV
jgi:hypothetical protein